MASSRRLVLRDFRAFTKNTLRGFATVELPSGLIIHEISVHTQNGKSWVAMPAAPQTTNGTVRVVAGKPQYKKLIGWKDRDLSDRFSEVVVAAVRAAHPSALAGE